MHKLSKAVEKKVQQSVDKVMQEKIFSIDTRVLLIGMAISLTDFQFRQILDRLYSITDKICLPLKHINDSACWRVKDSDVIKLAILNMISKNIEKINTTELETKLLKVNPNYAWRNLQSFELTEEQKSELHTGYKKITHKH
jgi:hypothetical protein